MMRFSKILPVWVSFMLMLLFPFSGGLSQEYKQDKGKKQNTEKLQYFAKKQSEKWISEKRKADSVAVLMNFPVRYKDKHREVTLQRLGPDNKPVYYITDNIKAAGIISADLLWNQEFADQVLTGAGINVHIWDGGGIRDTHREFINENESRVKMINRGVDLSDHSTHIAGTIAANGIDTRAKGIAGMAVVSGWDYNNDFAEMAIAASEGVQVSNHSYGSFCGWYFNSQTDSWYWYGDPVVSPVEDYNFGLYDQTSADLDYIAHNAPGYLIVKSAGNDRNDGPESQPVEHYVWDENWILVTSQRDNDGGQDGYDCLSPMSVSKNILTVGAVDDAMQMTAFSSFGPADDGRIKPDVVANGVEVYSTLSSSDEDYGIYSGTSMATASVTGAVALLNHLNSILCPQTYLNSSTLKALLIGSCREMGDATGPDYRYGWGLLNVHEAAELLEKNAGNGGQNVRELVINQGETLSLPLETESAGPLKITICWTDPPGRPSGRILNDRGPKLVNDLDIKLEFWGTYFYPWKLDPENPQAPAIQDENHVDNVEQILVADPNPGVYMLKISHTGILSGGTQSFSLVISGIKTPSEIHPAKELDCRIIEGMVRLEWNRAESGLPHSYRIYRNDKILAATEDNFYEDRQVTVNNEYDYYVTALYGIENKEMESLPTNTVHALVLEHVYLPYELDFEDGTKGIFIKNDESGWQFGNSESLNNYYLNYSANPTSFIGADSYSTGQTSHVSDMAETMPLRLAEYENVTVSFDYMLVSGLYNSVDELHIKYKMQDEEEWSELSELPPAMNWTRKSIDIPPLLLKNGIQIGFFYDDYYQWGMGAGLDNISIKGTAVRSVDWEVSNMNSPVSSCSEINEENISLGLRNAGTQAAIEGDKLMIYTQVSNGRNFYDTIVLDKNINPGEDLDILLDNKISLTTSGTYTFEFSIYSNLDPNPENNFMQVSIDIYTLPEVNILNTDLTFCTNGPPVLIETEPSGGSLSGPGIIEGMFYPENVPEGTHTLNYLWIDENNCAGTATAEIRVIAPPEPKILNTDLEFCINEPAVKILPEPEGGDLNGAGISGMTFVPATAGTGIHSLSYTVSDEHGCTGSVFTELTVHPLPEAKLLSTDLEFCIDEPAVEIKIIPEGILTGPGVSDMYFNPGEAGIGIHSLDFSFTDEGTSCSSSISFQTEVHALPEPQILNSNLHFCENEEAVLIETAPSGGSLTGEGIQDSYFDPSFAGAGSHFISYSYNDSNGCEASLTEEIIVIAPVEIQILNEDLSFCVNEEEKTIRIDPAGGTLTGTAVSGMKFHPALAGPGSFKLTYLYADSNECLSSAEFLVEVNPLPLLDLGPDLDLNYSDSLLLVPSGNALSFLWFDGSTESSFLVIGGNFDAGLHNIWVEGINEANCRTTDSLILNINLTGSGWYRGENHHRIIPNPFNDGFILRLNEGEFVKDVIVSGPSGKIYINGIPSGFPYFNMKNFPSGIYIIKIQTNRGISLSKIIKL